MGGPRCRAYEPRIPCWWRVASVRRTGRVASLDVADDRPPSPDRRRLRIALGYGTLNVAALGRLISGDGGSDRLAAAAGHREPSGHGPRVASAVTNAKPAPPDSHVYDIVIKGGRVIDPDSHYDRIADVGVDGTT